MAAISERGINPGEGSGEQPNPIAILNSLQPPIPNPDDKRDPIEARIYALLGDVTLPRSLYPVISAASEEKVREIEDPILRETHFQFLYKREKDNLIRSLGMTRLRREAGELFGRYTQDPIRNQSTAESHYVKEALALWAKMRNHAYEYFSLDGGRVKVDTMGKEADEILVEIRNLAGRLAEIGHGTISLDTEEINNPRLEGNDITFTFDQTGKIISLSMDEFKTWKTNSQFMHFIDNLPQELVNKIESIPCQDDVCDDCVQRRGLTIFSRNHEYLEKQNGIRLNASNLSENEVFSIIGFYVEAIKTYPRYKAA